MKSAAGILKHSKNLKAQVVLRKARLALRKTQPRKCKEGAPKRCRNGEIELQTDENGLGTDAGLENAENGLNTPSIPSKMPSFFISTMFDPIGKAPRSTQYLYFRTIVRDLGQIYCQIIDPIGFQKSLPEDLGFLDRGTPKIPQMDRFNSKSGPNWPYFGPCERDDEVNSRWDEIIENRERPRKMKSAAEIL